MIKKWIPVVLAVVLFASLGWGVPTILNNMIRPHAQDESTFPTNNFGQPAILFGTDAGALYLSPGDAGAWTVIGSGSGSSGACAGATDAGLVCPGVQSFPTGVKTFTGEVDALGFGLNNIVSSSVSTGIAQDFGELQLWINNARTIHMNSSLFAPVTTNIVGLGSSIYRWNGIYTGGSSSQIISGTSSGSDGLQLENNGARVRFGTGANTFCAANATGATMACPNLTVTGQQQVLAVSFMDGLPWTGQNARAAFSVPQAFTPQSFAFLGAEGTKTGTPPNIRWGITNPDGGECSGSFPCDQVCPDAGGVCSVPLTGQCSFSSSDIIFGTFLGGNGCVTNPASGAPIIVWGSLN